MTDLKMPYADLLPPLSTEEFGALAADIAAYGVHTPIVVDEDDNILDGHHRYKIDHSAPTRTVAGLSPAEKVAYVLSSNMKRRNLSSEQKAEQRKKMKACALQLAHDGHSQGEIGTLLGVTQQAVSLWFTTNTSTSNSCKPDTRVKIQPQATPDILAQLDAGKTQEQVAADYGVTQQAIAKHAAAARKKKEKEEAAPVPLPTGTYHVIYADPAWAYDNSGFEQSAASHYPTMTTEAICALPVADLCTPDTVLFLWATSPLLDQAFLVIEAWGFTYKAGMVWDKGKAPGIGWFVSTEHEHLLIATRDGNPHPATRPRSIIREAPGRHSAKPMQVYDLIESMYPGPYCELFARNARPGWEAWGNEV